MKNFLRRAGALAAAVMMCFALAVPACADSVLTGNAVLTTVATDSLPVFSIHVSGANVSSGGTTNIYLGTSKRYCGFGYVNGSGELYPAGSSIGVYLSWYYYSLSEAFTQSKTPTLSDFCIGIGDRNGVYTFQPISSVSLFNPGTSYASQSDGVSLVARVENSLGDPAVAWCLMNCPVAQADGSAVRCSFYVQPVTSWANSSLSVLCSITNFRVVGTSTSAELDALESMASVIAEQNQLLSAYYGDIVAICNEIYQRLGDMQQTQEEANALLSSLISLLNTTNSKISSLNQAMSTYFELVLKSLANESLSIQDCIDDAEARLELYLKPMIDYFVELEEQTGESAATLPQHKTDIDGFDNQGYGIDGDGQAGLAALLPIFGSFSWIFSVIAIFIGVGIINLLVKKGMS